MSETVVNLVTIFSTFMSSFTTGTCRDCPVDLLVNGQNDPPGIVILQDLKPGDQREVPKDLYADCKTPAKIYLHLKEVKTSQGIQTEPETLEEAGTPKHDLPNYIDYDLKLGDSVLISAADQIPFSEAVSCFIPLGTIPAKTHVPLYQSFHFDPTVTNWAQGDQTTFTEEFFAVDAASTVIPDSGTGRIWDPALKRCVPGPTPTVKPSPTVKPTSTPKPTHTPKPTQTPKPTPTPTPIPTPPPTPEACLDIEFSGPPILGTNNSENISGTPGNDLIFALGGHDKVEGGSGDDCIVGGPGHDRLNGNNGSDVLLGESGFDILRGNNDNDLLIGGPDADYADGDNGTDTCTAEIEISCEL